MAEVQVARRRAFDVWNEVPLVPQTTGMSCWAASAAMLIGWRESIPVDPEEVAGGIGRWQDFKDGLHPTDVDELARTWELVMDARVQWTPDALRDVLERFGPVWLGEASPALHSIAGQKTASSSPGCMATGVRTVTGSGSTTLGRSGGANATRSPGAS